MILCRIQFTQVIVIKIKDTKTIINIYIVKKNDKKIQKFDWGCQESSPANILQIFCK